MKRRIAQKVIKQFCKTCGLKYAYFKHVTGANARQLRAHLYRELNEAMEHYYSRQY